MVILTAIIYWLLICASLHCDVYYLIFQTVIFIYITGEHHLLSLINNVSSGLQLQSITKSITNVEAPIKEKYGRNIILGTHKEGGAVTFWSHAVSLPLSSNAILSWKFCHVVHKLLRDGHPNTLRDSRGHTASIRQMGTLWGNLHDRYGHIVALYAKLLCIKIDFHLKHLEIPPNLEAPEQVLDKAIAIDINKVFDMTGEVLEYMEAALKLQETVFRQMECSSTSSTTPVGQCRLAPLVLVIQDCGLLYHFLVKLLFKLHSRESCCLHAFRSCFWSVFVLHSLTQFFERARGMEFFKSIIQIPDLPDEPPNFLRAASLADHVKPMVVQNETFPDYDETDTQLDFGEGNYQMVKTTWIGQALKELEVVKPELELIKVEAQRAVVQLKSQVNKLESELEDQRTHKQMALVENERLRMEVENLRAQTAVAASIQATVEDTAQIHFTRLKEKHAELVSRHADLMRKNAEMVKQLSSTQQAQEELLTYKQQMAVEVEQLRQDNSSKLEAQRAEIERLKQELATERDEMFQVHNTLQSKEKVGSLSILGLQAQKEVLLRSVKEQEAEITNLRQAAQLHQATLLQERDRSQREMTVLQSQMQAKLSQDSGVLLQKLQDEQFSLLQCAVVEAEGMVLDAVAKVDDPLHVRCISTPDYLINRAELTLASIDKMQQSHVVYLRNMDDASGLLRSVTQFSHLISDTIVNGAGTAHSAPTDQADRLTDNCRDCATHCLQYLKELKLKATLPRADPTAVRYVVQRILNQGQDLLPRGADVRKEELAEMVDKEMAATSTAIEDAVLRMDEILSQARRDSSGVKLEVNQSIIGSCSDLMKAIHMLVTSATDLQRDIVESGRGAGSVKDFYAKNSCWTEGLISASKAVGWGATQMLESADKVVTDRGKYEELIVCSHEIAASTAQLVAASKVKADRGNRKLQTLQQASRHVNDMAAVVVSSTKSGQMQIENKNSMDFSSMSLIKLKTEEMDSQVKVLELEKQLANERIRLGGLRKKHYEIEGISTDSPPESAVNSFDSSLPTVFPDPPSMELPSLDMFTLDPIFRAFKEMSISVCVEV
uniref:Huntingtin interacting protein 1 related n=1 Tax=Cyprinus carpio TaxID=7962 RepID=A0A8C1WN92_CYPCA